MGASGGIGQPLSMLLKNSPLVTQLSLYDIVHTPGVAADLSHIESPAKVTGFVGPEQLPVSALILWCLLGIHPAEVRRVPRWFSYDFYSRIEYNIFFWVVTCCKLIISEMILKKYLQLCMWEGVPHSVLPWLPCVLGIIALLDEFFKPVSKILTPSSASYAHTVFYFGPCSVSIAKKYCMFQESKHLFSKVRLG